MPRALWKGAITFGLVHIPVALYPAAKENRVNFDWLDRRDMKPVGYKRVNKATGQEVGKDDIVKGIEVEDGRYVVLTDEEIRSANPDKTQTVDIQAFVDAKDIGPQFFDAPYVLAPTGRGEKVYLLLREALRESGRIGIATVVIQSKQHLAALLPQGDALMLNTLRWHDEIRALDELSLPGEAKGKTAPTDREMQMARQLIDDMAGEWHPEDYEDRSREDIMAMVQQKLDSGEVRRVEPVGGGDTGGGAEIIDLAELLRRSLAGGKAKGAAAEDEGEAAPRGRRRAANEDAHDEAPRRREAAAQRRGSTARTSATPARKAAGKTTARKAAPQRPAAADKPAARKRA